MYKLDKIVTSHHKKTKILIIYVTNVYTRQK